MTALLLPATGGDFSGNFRKPRRMVDSIVRTARMTAQSMAMSEKSQFEIEFWVMFSVLLMVAETWTTKKPWDTN
jgi:hypothetical protein